MNRQERRAAARGKNSQARHGGHSLDCGCTVRRLEVVEDVRCPDCGAFGVRAGELFMMPMTAPVSSLKTLEAGCACGSEFQLTCLVLG